MRLLEQAALALQKGAREDSVSLMARYGFGAELDDGLGSNLHGAVPVILDSLDLDLSSSHGGV